MYQAGKTQWDSMVYKEENPSGAICCTKRESPSWTVCCRKTLMGQYGVPRGKNSVGQNEAGFSWGKCHWVKTPIDSVVY